MPIQEAQKALQVPHRPLPANRHSSFCPANFPRHNWLIPLWPDILDHKTDGQKNRGQMGSPLLDQALLAHGGGM
eukprot:CAMPEP_0174357192 /NCGR_PEP_ID=MMETSP0811_2-20130205/34587_1 /TAXON_ID=73025 ORGANISM="Eutreptiella gymnastica-like, Strain CCMP1594" /NCGR_SAMPLE_ID=MMETSP0811_2 /ASSEMBLY_ACC=CAM_ASM_000667 /LENGTH=73 /DNA_ID=CAMNT_0015489791 /DNA_START=188 /DNA_END=409 /DNA_ORIENTATION=+